MNTLRNLIELFKPGSPVLDPEEELERTRMLRETDRAELAACSAEVRFIMEELSISHIENEYMFLAEEPEEYTIFFDEFGPWLAGANSELSLKIDPKTLSVWTVRPTFVEVDGVFYHSN